MVVKFDKTQYKLWAEALDVKKHDSRENPPAGPIWNSKTKKSTSNGSINQMTNAFTAMANSIATAFT